MASRVEVFAVTIPAGTAEGAFSQDISLARDGNVVQIEVIIPSGVNGVAGLALQNANEQVLPYVAGTYIVSNDEKITWNVSDYTDNGSWQAVGYNNGNYDHTFYVRFLVNEVGAAAQQMRTALSTDVMSLSGG